MIRIAPRSPCLVAADAFATLAAFQARLSTSSLTATVVASEACEGEAMLVIEMEGDDEVSATWIVTATAHNQLTLEAVVGEIRLDLVAVGPADRILHRLEALASPAVVNA